MIRSPGLAVLALLVSASPVLAQTPPPATITAVDVLVLPAGSDPATATPVAQLRTPIAASQGCNLNAPPPAVTPLVNPTAAFMDDPFAAGRYCRAAMPSGIPAGNNYIAVAQYIADTCVVNGATLTPCPSLRSAVATPPFNIQAANSRPAAPTGVVIRP
jgi:hypothetical protein